MPLELSSDKNSSGGTSPVKSLLIIFAVTMGCVVMGYLAGGLQAQSGAGVTAEPDGMSTDADGGETQTEEAFIEFEEVQANLSDARNPSYISLKISLAVAKENEAVVADALKRNMPKLRNWLILALSDMTVEKIAGADGKNALRRMILDEFNNILFGNGVPMLRGVYIQRCNVQ